MEIQIEDLRSCLKRFGIAEEIQDWKLLADGPDHPVNYDEVIRKIIQVDLMDGKRYVIKFIRETVFPTEMIESQSAFSDLLLDNGVIAPRRIKAAGKYCLAYEKDDKILDVTLEEWMGEKIPHMTLELCGQMGALLGKTHRIAMETQCRIGYSFFYDEILTHDTSYEKLWKNVRHDYIPEDFYREFIQLYDRKLEKVKRIWPRLPRAAVQGDIYSCNNIVLRDGQLGLFDFNLSGDEVLLGDILICWFRTIFDENMQEDLEKIPQTVLWSSFIGSYQKERPFTAPEKEIFADVYALLGVVYYTKLLFFMTAKGRQREAKEKYPFLMTMMKGEDPCHTIV